MRSPTTARLFLAALLVLLLAGCAPSPAAADKCTVPSQRVQCGALTCNASSGKCIPCTSAAQCWDKSMKCAKSALDSKTRGAFVCELITFADVFKTRPGGAIGSILVAVGICAIAVIGGVGGGGILVPLFKVLMSIPLGAAVGLSQATIVGQSAFNVFLQVQRFHPKYQPPKPTRPMVNWSLLLYWLPISLVGTMWGNLAGKVVPDWFRMVLLFVLLSYALKRMVDRMIIQRAEDQSHQLQQKQEAAAAAAAMQLQQQQRPPAPHPESDTAGLLSNKSSVNGAGGASVVVVSGVVVPPLLQQASPATAPLTCVAAAGPSMPATTAVVVAATAAPSVLTASVVGNPTTLPVESQQPQQQQQQSQVVSPMTAMMNIAAASIAAALPNDTAGASITTTPTTITTTTTTTTGPPPAAFAQFPQLQIALLLLTFLVLLLANVSGHTYAVCGTPGRWAILVAATAHNVVVSLVYRQYLAKIHTRIERGIADTEKIPFEWNDRVTIWFPILSVTAGAAASLLGIGGGLILSFLFLEAGLVPEEASATSGVATFMVALESMLQFIVQGSVRFDYLVVFFLAGVLSTAIGQLGFMPVIRARGWRFLIVASLAFIMAASMLTLTAVGIYDTITLLNHDGSIGFGSMCPAVSPEA